MGSLAWASCFVIAGVFGVAGVTKLRDPAGTAEAFTRFGVPPRFAGHVAIGVPVLELAVAIAVLVPLTTVAGAIGAAALITIFSAAIAIRLARGEDPPCHCFGQREDARVGPATLIRNAVLLGFAVFAATQRGTAHILAGPHLAFAGWAALVVLVVLSVAVAAEGWLLVNAIRQHGRLLLRIEDLEAAVLGAGAAPADRRAVVAEGHPVGTLAPPLPVRAVDGTACDAGDLLALSRPLVIVFVDPGCVPCAGLLPDTARWQREHGDSITIALVTRGDPAALRAEAHAELAHVFMQHDHEIADALRSPGTPSAVLIGTDRRIATPMAVGADAVRRLVHRAVPQPVLARSNGQS